MNQSTDSALDIAHNHSQADERGFTIVELVTVIVVLAILAAAVIAKSGINTSQTTTMTALDQAVADIQYTQMRAMADRGAGAGLTISIVFTSGSGTYTIRDASNNVIETRTLPGGAVAGNNRTFAFNTLGELIGGSNLSVTIGSSTITVYAITGKTVVS